MPTQEINMLLELHPHLQAIMGPELNTLYDQLLKDKKRGHLSEEQFANIEYQLHMLVQATIDLDVPRINQTKASLNELCSYSRAAKSKWTMVGLIVGAIIEAAALTVIMVATKGAALPILAIVADVGTASFFGALFGHKIGQFKANTKINNLVGNSAKTYLEGDNPQGRKVDTSELVTSRFDAFKKRLSHTKDDANDTDTQKTEQQHKVP